ncbi:MAG TPA: MBL fold metallo-hydrolase, partial [Methylomirabilota bacterium]|nr:MBL fold metallo-hydrolase [Methylomirabilota bacterium]
GVAMSRHRREALLLALMLPLTFAAWSPPPPVHTEVAPGVHLFRTQPYGDVGLDGNSVAIITDAGVLVFDANGTPAAARAVLAELRKLTKQPVRYLVYSHWHWDHWYGAEVYAQAFPGLTIVSHEKTRALMAGPAIAFNQPGLDEQLPAHIRDVELDAAHEDSVNARSAEAKAAAEHLERDRFFLAQKRGVRHTLATLTFTDSLTLHLGSMVIQVLHIERAITPGDAFLRLPAENLVVSGDLLINPVTYALFCYPAGWIRTLEYLDALDAATIVPGHGDALRDETLLHATLALLKRERELALAAKGRGEAVDKAKAAILADTEVQRLRGAITGGDAKLNGSFAVYLVDWFVRRVYAEADGPLTDSIPSSP